MVVVWGLQNQHLIPGILYIRKSIPQKTFTRNSHSTWTPTIRQLANKMRQRYTGLLACWKLLNIVCCPQTIRPRKTDEKWNTIEHKTISAALPDQHVDNISVKSGEERWTNTAEQRFLHYICTRRQALGIFYYALEYSMYQKLKERRTNTRVLPHFSTPRIYTTSYNAYFRSLLLMKDLTVKL